MAKIIFLKEPLDSPNRQADVIKMPSGRYHIINTARRENAGDLNDIWSLGQMYNNIRSKKAKFYPDPEDNSFVTIDGRLHIMQ